MPPKLERCVTSFMSNPRNTKKWPNEKERRSAAFAICNAAIKGGEQRSFITELAEDGSSWVHLIRYGEFDHPVHGKITIDKRKIGNFVKNFKNNVRGQMLDVNFAHRRDNSKGEKAAGWFSDLSARADGLWGKVSWTPTAQQEIQDGEWKYMSVEYEDEWCSPEGGCFDDVLMGAALTNRPFIKELVPVNLDEFELDGLFDQPEGKFSQEDAHYRMADDSSIRCANCAFFQPNDNACLVVDGSIDGDWVSMFFKPMYNQTNSMIYDEKKTATSVQLEEVKNLDLAVLAGLLGLDDTASERDAVTAIVKLQESAAKIVTDSPKPDPTTVDPNAPKPKGVRLTELAEAFGMPEESSREELLEKARSTRTPEVTRTTQFQKMFPEEFKQFAETRKALAEAELSRKLDEWHRGDQVGGIPPSADESIREVWAALPQQSKQRLDDMISIILKNGLVPLSESGATSTILSEGGDAFMASVRAAQVRDKITYADAVRQVSRAHPELAESYRKGVAKAAEEVS